MDSLPAPRLSSLKRTWRCHTSSRASSRCDDSKPPCCLIATNLRKVNFKLWECIRQDSSSFTAVAWAKAFPAGRTQAKRV
ncbi:MAG: hypothetical protein J5814_02865 [Bacteroidaceae bacterium]|nr:hypothetical protein [Bacteroidaceae bacterium]